MAPLRGRTQADRRGRLRAPLGFSGRRGSSSEEWRSPFADRAERRRWGRWARRCRLQLHRLKSGQSGRPRADQADPVGALNDGERPEHPRARCALMAEREEGDLDLDRREPGRPRLGLDASGRLRLGRALEDRAWSAGRQIARKPAPRNSLRNRALMFDPQIRSGNSAAGSNSSMNVSARARRIALGSMSLRSGGRPPRLS